MEAPGVVKKAIRSPLSNSKACGWTTAIFCQKNGNGVGGKRHFTAVCSPEDNQRR